MRLDPELESSSYFFFHATLEHFKKGLSFFASKSLLKSTGLQYIYSGFKIICLHVVCMYALCFGIRQDPS